MYITEIILILVLLVTFVQKCLIVCVVQKKNLWGSCVHINTRHSCVCRKDLQHKFVRVLNYTRARA